MKTSHIEILLKSALLLALSGCAAPRSYFPQELATMAEQNVVKIKAANSWRYFPTWIDGKRATGWWGTMYFSPGRHTMAFLMPAKLSGYEVYHRVYIGGARVPWEDYVTEATDQTKLNVEEFEIIFKRGNMTLKQSEFDSYVNAARESKEGVFEGLECRLKRLRTWLVPRNSEALRYDNFPAGGHPANQ